MKGEMSSVVLSMVLITPEVLGPIPVQAILLGVALDDPCGSPANQNIL